MEEHKKNLKKLEFSVKTDTGDTLRFSFIYGIVPEGLSGFEKSIVSLQPGDSFIAVLDTFDLVAAMDRLFPLFIKQTKLTELSRITRIEFTLETMCNPPAAEIVSSMAEIQRSRSCSGSCDCGCH